jgi:hypothetical protein
MSEITLQWLQAVKILTLGVFAMLYGFGGVSGKWKRRFIAPVLYVLGVCGVTLWTNTFNAWFLLCAPLLFGGLSLGYGATTTAEKIKKRSICGLACALGSLPIFLVTQAYTLLALHIVVCVLTSVIAGTFNQTSSARAEETMIGASYVLIPLFTV